MPELTVNDWLEHSNSLKARYGMIQNQATQAGHRPSTKHISKDKTGLHNNEYLTMEI